MPAILDGLTMPYRNLFRDHYYYSVCLYWHGVRWACGKRACNSVLGFVRLSASTRSISGIANVRDIYIVYACLPTI